MNRFDTTRQRLSRRFMIVAGCCVGFLHVTTAISAAPGPDSTAHHVESHSTHAPATDTPDHLEMLDHAAHMQAICNTPGYQRSEQFYDVPNIELTDSKGNNVSLGKLFETDRPVILNFIFTSCTTVCPILTATLSQANEAFIGDEVQPLLVSISIDPQYDSPSRLKEYAARNHAGDNWVFLTGDLNKVLAIQRAFGAYFGTKMNHQPVTFLRRAPDDPWIRLQGFTSSASLVTEYRALFTHPG